jgi:hypothetical protein
MPSVYVETTIISYLTSRQSGHVIVAGHQETTRNWWDTAGPRYNLFVSEPVLRELAAGDPDAAALRLQRVKNIPLLSLNDDVVALAQLYHDELRLPPKAGNDVLHPVLAVTFSTSAGPLYVISLVTLLTFKRVMAVRLSRTETDDEFCSGVGASGDDERHLARNLREALASSYSLPSRNFILAEDDGASLNVAMA